MAARNGSGRAAILVALAVVLGWLVIGGLAGPRSGQLSEVATNDNTAFLPSDAEATLAQRAAQAFVDRPSTPAVVVYERPAGLTAADRERVAADAVRITAIDGVVSPLPPAVPSDDGQAIQLVVPIDASTGADIDGVIEELRVTVGTDDQGRPTGTDGLVAHVSGPAGLLADLIAVFKTIDVTLLLVTAGVVLVILLIIYRSPILWVIPLLSAGMAYAVAAAAVYLLARDGVITLNGQAQGILTVLVFGAGTDYALLLVARYREELSRHERPVSAMRVAWRGAAPAIVASGLTVIASLLCLLLSGLNSNRALGPVAAVGIAATLLVMLTFLPALLLLGGRWVFWPRRPRLDDGGSIHGIWHRIAGVISRHARLTWMATAVVLAAAALGLTQLGATSLGQSDAFTRDTDSVAGQAAISRHFPGGAGSPASVIAAADRIDEVTAAVRGVPGVAEVRALPAASGPASPAAAPKVVDGRIQLQATLADPPDGAAAERTIRELRAAVHAVPGARALVGGFTAINLDIDTAAQRDRNVIIPTVLAVIAVILALLLRSLVAPVLLIATVVLSFVATLGVCALLFRHVFGFPGVDASFPLFAFVFLVALGIDYNIFLMSRVREESLRSGSRPGVVEGLTATGGVITSAGVVLAATFSALAVLPLVVLVELGVAVAVGVLIDTVVVRSLLVPALAYDLGRAIWWPGRLWRRPSDPAAERPTPAEAAHTIT